MTLKQALGRLLRDPKETLLLRWNWKAAILASILRGLIFFFSNLKAGWHAAQAALVAEFLYRAVTSGLWGALTQAFYEVQPPWVGTLFALILVPLVSHALELAVHVIRGTPNLWTSMLSSVCFTAISTLFNLFAMRHGALTVGEGASSFREDLQRLPKLIAQFVAAGPLALVRRMKRITARDPLLP